MPVAIYAFWMHAGHLDGLARLNGYPVGRGIEDDVHSANKRVNDLLIEGVNVFTLDLSRRSIVDGQNAASMLTKGELGNVDERTTLFEHKWREIDGLPADGTRHEVLRHELRLDRAWGRWRWQDARPYRKEDFAEIVAIHRAVVAAAKARDVARLVDLFRIKYREIDRSVDEPSSDEADAASWSKMFASTTDVLAAREDDLVATSWSDGRLVDVTTKGGEAPVTLVLDGGSLGVPYVVSALSEGLRIVR